MKDFNEINIFARVAQVGSFSKAAKDLDMPVSTVSRKVSELESRLGITLIQRTTRKLQLTGVGEAYLNQCVELLQGFDEAESRITQTNILPEGLLRVTIPVGLAGGTFSNFVSNFLKKFPRIQLDLVVTNQYVDIIAENVDLAIRMGPLNDSSLIAKRLGYGKHLLVASPEFVKTFGEPNKPMELKNFECIVYRSHAEEGFWELTQGQTTQKIKVSGQVRASDMIAIRALALKGHGIANLPDMYCTKEIAAGTLQQILPTWNSPLAPVHAVYPNRKFLPSRVACFIKDLEEWKDLGWQRK